MLRPDGLLVHYAWESSLLFSTIKIKDSDSELFNNHNWEKNLHNTAILTMCYGDLYTHHCQSLTAYIVDNCDIQKLQRLESKSCLVAKTGTSMYSQVLITLKFSALVKVACRTSVLMTRPNG